VPRVDGQEQAKLLKGRRVCTKLASKRWDGSNHVEGHKRAAMVLFDRTQLTDLTSDATVE
jgi:hypothetical protein